MSVPLRIALCLSFCLLPASTAAADQPRNWIDFSKLTHPSNQMGLMHGAITHWRYASTRAATTARAKDLQPSLWRGTNAPWSMSVPLALRDGATPIHLLSDAWNVESPNPNPGCKNMYWWHNKHQLPFQNWSAWQNWVKAQAQQMAMDQPSGDIWVDVWNEPDLEQYWPVRRHDGCYPPGLVDWGGQKWLETWGRAERVLRQTLGSRVKMIGPSTSGNTVYWADRLAEYCAAHGCRIDAVAWHSCAGDQNTIDRFAPTNARMRSLMASKSTWRKAMRGPRTPILMTEYMAHNLSGKPGAFVSYWASLERSGMQASALAEWNDRSGRLQGLLSSSGLPRSTWWAAWSYAKGRSRRVASGSSDTHWSLIATRRGISGYPELLLGNNSSSMQSVKLSLRNLGAIGIGSKFRFSYISLPEISQFAPRLNLKMRLGAQAAVVRNGQAVLNVKPAPGAAVLIALIPA